MNDVTIESVDGVPAYTGPHELPQIRFRPMGRALGVTAWGMNVLDLGPHADAYPEHDHTADGQEEVYVVLRGGGRLVADGAEHALSVGQLARVAPHVRRKLLPGSEGMVVLAIGGTPGQAFKSSLG